jgi:hypothetical protein
VSISSTQAYQAACEAALRQLRAQGLRADSESSSLLRQCVELCELHVQALRKQSPLVRRTSYLLQELSARLARVVPGLAQELVLEQPQRAA